MKITTGGITAPQGFTANGLNCGIKKSGKPDLALIYSETPCATAAVYTANSIQAAPLKLCKKHLRDKTSQAIVINSGNANCFTGDFGYLYAEQTTEVYAKLLGLKKKDVLVASTGIIGKPLPFHLISQASQDLIKGKSNKGSTKAAKAILTTDTFAKEQAYQVSIGGKKVLLGGIAKGSGMINPSMATMLGFITTDVKIDKKLLSDALTEANGRSFNCITVDGCMSTNDMVVVQANGLAGNKIIKTKGEDYQKFVQVLTQICLDLAKDIVKDGEGATKFITVHVTSAENQKQADLIAKKIANDNLVKTACFGESSNWGRVAAAVGSLGIKKITEEKLKMNFSPVKDKEITIEVDVGLGEFESYAYTSDLSYEYVRINAEYN